MHVGAPVYTLKLLLYPHEQLPPLAPLRTGVLIPQYVTLRRTDPRKAHQAQEVGFWDIWVGGVGSWTSKPLLKLGASLQWAHPFGHTGSISCEERHG